ncbi:MAG TPA: tetratricopeptide repeat protein [Kofleriaceae bacterium]|nr:tetratricopeptide repeat protein [Kofleriaceae bacterium]
MSTIEAGRRTFGNADGVPPDAISLQRVIDAERRLDELSCARVVGHAAEAVHAAQEGGQPLATVTPAAIVLRPDGSVKLALGSASSRYAAPERLRGGKGDRRSDVFALGIALWEALAHERLFDGATEDAIQRAVLERAIRPPSELNANVPAELDAICKKALARDPADRYQSARVMAAEIDAVLGDAGYPPSNDPIARYVATALAAAPAAPQTTAPSSPVPQPAGPAAPAATASPAPRAPLVPGAASAPGSAPAPSPTAPATARSGAQTQILGSLAAAAGPLAAPTAISEPSAGSGPIRARTATAAAMPPPAPPAPLAGAVPPGSAAPAEARPAAREPGSERSPAMNTRTATPAKAAATEILGSLPSGSLPPPSSGPKAPARHAARATVAASPAPPGAASQPPAIRGATAASPTPQAPPRDRDTIVDSPATLVTPPPPHASTLPGIAAPAAALDMPPGITVGPAMPAVPLQSADRDLRASRPEPGGPRDTLPDVPHGLEKDTERMPEPSLAMLSSHDERATGGRDVLAGWGWSTGSVQALDEDDYQDVARAGRRRLLIATGAALGVVVILVIVAFAFGGSRSRDEAGDGDRARGPSAAPTAAASLAPSPAAPPATAPAQPATPGPSAAAGSAPASAGPAAPEPAGSAAAAEPAAGEPRPPAEPPPAESPSAGSARSALAEPAAPEPPAPGPTKPALAGATAPAAAPKAPGPATPEPAAIRHEPPRTGATTGKHEAAAPTAAIKAPAPTRAALPGSLDARKPADPRKPAERPLRRPLPPDRLAKATSRPQPVDPYGPSTPAGPAASSSIDPATAYRNGLQQYARGDTSGALATFRSSLSSNPRFAPTWRGIGLVYEKMGNRGQARSAFKRYLQLAPDAGDAEQIRERLERLGP